MTCTALRFEFTQDPGVRTDSMRLFMYIYTKFSLCVSVHKCLNTNTNAHQARSNDIHIAYIHDETNFGDQSGDALIF